MIRWYVARAIFKRNFVSYFTSPTGYVFITIFILLSAMAAFLQERFFGGNLANLDPLNRLFPILLLFFVPTITMSTWAEERRQGTDELLLTLPARDLELAIGKYLSALGIYSVSLGFSLVHVFVLGWLGRPDFGVMIGTYLGYWMLGASLIAVGMVGSLLTSSMTVAFILGALFCAVPTFIDHAGALLSGRMQHWVESVGAVGPFRDFASGVLSWQGLIYFICLTSLMLYLNLVLLARRHIAGGPGSSIAWVHFGVRAASFLVAAVSITVLAGRYLTGCDLTEERLHSLTKETRELIWKTDPARPVYVQAYISPEVPRTYVETRETLIALLREYAAQGGDRIQLKIVDTERYSPEAREAEEKFGIKAERINLQEEGRQTHADVFLGVAMTSGVEEAVIPFMHKGLSIEYELTRSLGVVSGAKRKKVGIASTDAKLFGGFNFEAMTTSPAWQIVDELRKQYDVVEVQLDQPIVDRLDVLVVPMASSLTQPQMNTLLAHIARGGPTLLCDDPMPYFNPQLAPHLPKKGPGRGPFGQPSPEQKGNFPRLLEEVGIQWPSDDIVWDTWNPHPDLQEVPREIVFVGPGSGAADAFSPNDPVASGLQEMVVLFAGHVRPRGGSAFKFTPLLRTTKQAGTVAAREMFSGFGRFNTDLTHDPSGLDYVLAAHVTGTAPAPPPKEGEPPAEAPKINVVFLADTDMISDMFFDFRRQGLENWNFDNVTFMLNCVDVLSGDLSYVTIRKRRPKHRTLEEVERRTKEHTDRRLSETKQAEESAKKKVQEAQDRLNKKLQELRDRKDIDDQQKQIMLETVQEAENRRLQVAQKNIEDEKNASIERSRATMEQAVRAIQNRIKVAAVLFTPLPALFIGLLVLVFRLARERRAA